MFLTECKISTLFQKKTSLLYNTQNEIIVNLLLVLVCLYFQRNEKEHMIY